MVNEVSGEIEEPHADDVAIISAAFDKRERVAIELRHHTEEKISGGTGRSSVVISTCHFRTLPQEIGINARGTVRDDDCADGFLIKVDGPCGADNSVDVTQVTQTVQARNQQRGANASTLKGLANSSGPKEISTRALVCREPNDLPVHGRDKNRDRLICKTDGNFVRPTERKLVLDECSQRADLEWLRPADRNTLLFQLRDQGFKRRQFGKVNQQVRHMFEQALRQG